MLAAIEGADVALVPTLKVWQHHLRDEPASVRARSASTSTGQLRAWRGAGGTVLFGTDAGGMNDYDPSDEYALMAEAGMDVSRDPCGAHDDASGDHRRGSADRAHRSGPTGGTWWSWTAIRLRMFERSPMCAIR